MMNRCLCCYQPLDEQGQEFHLDCSLAMFGQKEQPELHFSGQLLAEYFKELLEAGIALTGVQPKIEVGFDVSKDIPRRHLSIVGASGGYILKPATEMYPDMPELEDLTMHLARLAKIPVVQHSLIRTSEQKLAYITKRIDRMDSGHKIHMEDLCQLSEKLTEQKYKSTYEQAGKQLMKYSSRTGLDALQYADLVLFSFLTGNADMHLKNFSLIDKPGTGYLLAPAYDLVPTSIMLLEDKEELALPLNGKKNRLKRSDFDTFYDNLKIPEKIRNSSYKRFKKAVPEWLDFIEISFISKERKQQYKELVLERAGRVEL
jgi:serine/threonine-protein kinase HipA